MKIYGDILNNQFIVLDKYGYSIKNTKYVHTSEKNIVYHADIIKDNKDLHCAIMYEFDTQKASIQLYLDNTVKTITKECMDVADFHNFVVNTIVKYF